MSSWRLPRRFRGISSAKTSLPHNVVGVVQNIDELVAVINDPNRPTSDRVTAAGIVRSSIETHSVSSIQEIWYSTISLLDLDNQPEVRRAGWRLMISCVAHDDINNGAFAIYYNTLVSQSNVEDFDLILESLKQLTLDGKRVLGGAQLAPCRLPIVLISWIQLLAVRGQEIRSNSMARDVLEQWGSSSEACFHSLLEYSIATLKFNMGLYEPSDLENLLLCTVAIVRNTSSIRDAELCCQLIDTIMAFGTMPVVVLQPVLEVLCGVNAMVPSLADHSWSIIRKLYHSHLRSSTLVRLCRILEAIQHSEITVSMRVGACTALRKIVLDVESTANSKKESAAHSGAQAGSSAIASGNLTPVTTASSNTPPNSGGEGQIRETLDAPMLELLTSYIVALRTQLSQPSIKLVSAISDGMAQLLSHSSTFTDARTGIWIWQDVDSSPLTVLTLLGQICQEHDSIPSTADENSNASTQSNSASNLSYWAHGGSMVGAVERQVTPSAEDSTSHTETSLTSPDQPSNRGDLYLKLQECLNVLTELLNNKACNAPIEESCRMCLELSPMLTSKATMTLIQCLETDQFCSPYIDGWKSRVDLVLSKLYVPKSTSVEVRSAVLRLIKDMYLLNPEEAAGTAELSEKTFAILDYADADNVATLIRLYKELYTRSEINWDPFERTTERMLTLFTDKHNTTPTENKIQIAAVMASLFAKALPIFSRQAKFLFKALVTICQNSLNDPEPFRASFAALCRLRSDFVGRLIFTEPLLEVSYGKDVLAKQPEAPEEAKKIIDQPSLVLACTEELGSDQADTALNSENNTDTNVALISMTPILELYNKSLSSPSEEVFTVALSNMTSQLSNMRLFSTDSQAEVLAEIRNKLLGLVSTRKLPYIPASQSSRVVCISIAIHTLTVMLPYDKIFPRPEQDRLLQQLTLALNHWDQSSHWAIHCLITCCYECPLSVQRFLPQLLSIFQTKITRKESSMYILEFLLSISLIESLTDNFNTPDFKRVFAMCFTYIQNANDLLTIAKQPIQPQQSTSSQQTASSGQETSQQSQQQQQSSQKPTSTDPISEIIAQYQLRLAYTAICYLYLAIRLQSRRVLASYIIRSLILADNNTKNVDPMSMAVYDLISRYTYSDLPLSLHSRIAGESISGEIENYDVRRWLRGVVVLEIRMHRQTGDGMFIVRRPTGTLVSLVTPAVSQASQLALLGSQNAAKKGELSAADEDSVLFSANFAMIEMQHLQMSDLSSSQLPIPVPFDPQIDRAIAAIDRTPVLDFHKVGLVYIAPRQKTEVEILGNRSGSASYRKFLSSIGSLIKLKNNKQYYVGGLDTEQDLDGEYAYCWRSKISQIIFHTTTMMPNMENDTTFSSKKRHIGNNFVNIYYDESGEEFDFDIVKSQFNFINVVVTPTYIANKWRVRAYRKEGLANALTAYEMKVISEQNLPLFVRNLALKASQYAAVHNMAGEYTDNWVYRIKQVEQLKERLAQRQATSNEDGSDNEGDEDGPSGLEENNPLVRTLDFTKYTY